MPTDDMRLAEHTAEAVKRIQRQQEKSWEVLEKSCELYDVPRAFDTTGISGQTATGDHGPRAGMDQSCAYHTRPATGATTGEMAQYPGRPSLISGGISETGQTANPHAAEEPPPGVYEIQKFYWEQARQAAEPHGNPPHVHSPDVAFHQHDPTTGQTLYSGPAFRPPSATPIPVAISEEEPPPGVSEIQKFYWEQARAAAEAQLPRSVRFRVNVSRTATGKTGWDCTVETTGMSMEEVLDRSDRLVEALSMRYPAPKRR